MKGISIVIGLGVLAAGAGFAYAMTSRDVTLVKGQFYTWVDSRGFPAADTKAQYESLGFGSVSIVQAVSGWALQAVWTGPETVWDVPEGLTKPQAIGALGA